MATHFHFDLVSPERMLFSAEVSAVSVPGSEGDFGVLAGHAPVMSTIRPGILSVEGEGGKHDFVLLGGFADITPDGLTVLAEKAYEREAIDRDALAQSIKDAEEDVADAQTDESRAQRAEKLDQLKALEALL